MPIVKTEAFVCKSFRYGDSSKIVTLFTKDYGKLSAIVKGARSHKSKFCGIFETMNHINIILYLKNNRELQIVSNADYKKSFANILTDLNKIQIGYKILETLNKSILEYEMINGLFNLLAETFEKLNVTPAKTQNYYLCFQINLVKLLGLSPDLTDSKENNLFETFFEDYEFRLNKSQFDNLRSVHKFDFANIDNMNMESNDVLKLSNFYEKYLLFHTQSSRFSKTSKVFNELKQLI